MKLIWLADALRDAGLNVIEEPGWKTRGRDWVPIGNMTHHTAPPNPYPVDRLYDGGQIKCNFSVQPGPELLGQIHVVAAGACNYSSGRGSSLVRKEVAQDIAPSRSARKRGLPDDSGGNSYYVNNEVSHPGDGSPLSQAMYRHIYIAWAVICTRMGWSAQRNIGHGEHSGRKIDPYMNGLLLHAFMEKLRADVSTYMSGDKLLSKTLSPLMEGEEMFRKVNYKQGYGTKNGDLSVHDWQQIFVSLGKLDSDRVDGKAGPTFLRIVRELAENSNNSKPVSGDEILGPEQGGRILAHYQR